MSYPDVMVGIPAYNRPDTVRITVEKLLRNLNYEGNIRIVVSEDGDYDATRLALARVGDGSYALKEVILKEVILVDGPKKGLGANLNCLLSIAERWSIDFILNMDDDHWLEESLDLTPHVLHLQEDIKAGWIRFYGIGHHNYVGVLKGRYWYVKWNSPDLYIPSFRPHLKHIRFHNHFGKYPEGRTLAMTEEGFCHQCKDKARKVGGPQVLVPLMYDLDWSHGVGVESWQSKGH